MGEYFLVIEYLDKKGKRDSLVISLKGDLDEATSQAARERTMYGVAMGFNIQRALITKKIKELS